MLILICSLINISENNSPIGIGESSNDSKRELEEQIDNYIILQFNQEVSYAGGKFLKHPYNHLDYNKYISYIMNGNEKIDRNTQFTVKSNTKLEVHFNQTITTLESFLDEDFDSQLTYLISVYFCHFDTSSVTNMASMFYQCSSLQYLNLSNFDTSSVTNMEGMFSECTSLKYLIISNFDFTTTESTNDIFGNVNNLEYIDIYNIKGSQNIQDKLNELNSEKLTVCQNNANAIITEVINNCLKNIDDNDDILVCNNIQTTIPLIQTTIPQIQTTIPQIQTTIPQIQTTIPLIHSTIPQIQTTIPQIQTTIPLIQTTIPLIQTTIP